MSLRITKVNDLLRDLISQALTREVSFKPGVVVTITKLRTTKDLRHAYFSVSIFPETETDYVLSTLKKEMSQLERFVHSKLYMKPLPRLHFEVDTTSLNADAVEKILLSLEL
jgi:ribosome-binding factor A